MHRSLWELPSSACDTLASWWCYSIGSNQLQEYWSKLETMKLVTKATYDDWRAWRERQHTQKLVASLPEMSALGDQLLNQPQFPVLTFVMSVYTANETRQETFNFGPTLTTIANSTIGSSGDIILLAAPAPTSTPGCSNKRRVPLFCIYCKDTHLVEITSFTLSYRL